MGLQIEDLVKAAKHQGWEVKDTADGHLFLPADKSQSPFTAHRGANENTMKKNLSQLRRRGLVYP